MVKCSFIAALPNLWSVSTLPMLHVSHPRPHPLPLSLSANISAENSNNERFTPQSFIGNFPTLPFKRLFRSIPHAISFQGEESKIIILSLVRSNRNADIGFLRSSNRCLRPLKYSFTVAGLHVCIPTSLTSFECRQQNKLRCFRCNLFRTAHNPKGTRL